MPKSLWKGLFLSDFLTEAFLNSSRNLYTTAELALQAILSFMSYTHIAEVSVVTCRWGPGTFQYMGPKNQNGGLLKKISNSANYSCLQDICYHFCHNLSPGVALGYLRNGALDRKPFLVKVGWYKVYKTHITFGEVW